MKQFVAILCLFPFAASAQLRKAGTTPDIHPDYLRVAQGQIGRDQPDSAIATLNEAVATGADRASVAQFLLVSGNMLYGSNDAATPPQRKDYQRAASLLVASDSIVPSPETKYVLGVGVQDRRLGGEGKFDRKALRSREVGPVFTLHRPTEHCRWRVDRSEHFESALARYRAVSSCRAGSSHKIL